MNGLHLRAVSDLRAGRMRIDVSHSLGLNVGLLQELGHASTRDATHQHERRSAGTVGTRRRNVVGVRVREPVDHLAVG